MRIELVSVELFQLKATMNLPQEHFPFWDTKSLPGVMTGFRAPVDGFGWFQSLEVCFWVLRTDPWE
jgi:hypothetical protein